MEDDVNITTFGAFYFTVPKVDKICGPGNAYVTAAKMIVQNDSESAVAIDMPAGPSEVMLMQSFIANPYDCNETLQTASSTARVMWPTSIRRISPAGPGRVRQQRGRRVCRH
jgi:hypothetical protein